MFCLCQLCWRRNECHTTVPSLSSYLVTSPFHQHCSCLARYLPNIFCSSTVMPRTDQFLEFTKCQMSHWELKVDEKTLESWWKLLESSITYPLEKYTVASIRASTTSPGSPAVLWALAEFDVCSRSAGHFWLLALCHILLLMVMFCSRASQLQERRGKPPLLAQAFLPRFNSDPLSFPHQRLGPPVSLGWPTPSDPPSFRGWARSKVYFGAPLTLKSGIKTWSHC